MNKFEYTTTKSNGQWIANLFEIRNSKKILKDTITKDSFSELMIEIGSRTWVDMVNKNE
ncbi:hypothetical protein HWC99_gp03 [Flavobacterium phage vB_FspS_tant8-1]|uniref:Uncharacterized protein n=1 Tax=Flavobacterium phage vB_FspS_tant8-1 TaxID=2686278 RepID=A0A6B9LUY8_9CAUD|nr:hypothetical protein HWC99_gp03 [Flavobacterium phage vB_FspS_tant8-1]QHB40934.1 hypothetical protein tant81_gp003 [Flavobacterium phage vB_FspS_tant8-1]